jgi:hypothetical protein
MTLERHTNCSSATHTHTHTHPGCSQNLNFANKLRQLCRHTAAAAAAAIPELSHRALPFSIKIFVCARSSARIYEDENEGENFAVN